MSKIRRCARVTFPLDDRLEKAARHVVVTYDKLGLILKHDQNFERRVLEWHGEICLRSGPCQVSCEG